MGCNLKMYGSRIKKEQIDRNMDRQTETIPPCYLIMNWKSIF